LEGEIQISGNLYLILLVFRAYHLNNGAEGISKYEYSVFSIAGMKII